MAGSSNSMAENKWEITKILSEPSKEMKDSGVQTIGGRIYDSENGKFCHQCRQKTRDFAVSCKKLKKHKPCTITFCHRCLLNRYGEKAVEVVKLEDWVCPKCRDVCNCSCCMKKKGFQPTGKLVPTAKAAGFNSVVGLLHNKGSKGLEPAERNALLESSPLPNKGLATSKRCLDEGNCCVELNKKRKPSTGALSTLLKEKIVLPLGSILTIVVGIELPVEDIGAALQFVEFCTAFSKILCIKEGQPDHILQELTRECVGRQGANSSIVQFHVKLLSLIKKDLGKGSSWVEALEKCIKGSHCILDGFPIDFPIKDSFWYCDLEPSKKLRLVNFLCDEILGTKEVRNWIDKENAKFDEEVKKNKEKLLEARRKEKHLKQQLKDEMAKSILSMGGGAPLSLSEHNDLISKLKAEADEAHSEMLGIISLLPEKKQRSAVVRTEPILLEGNGLVYWKLKSYNNSSNIILQDIGNWDPVTLEDKWFTYDEEQEKVVQKHVSSLRNCRPTIHRQLEKYTSADDVQTEHHDANNSETQNCSNEGAEINKSSTIVDPKGYVDEGDSSAKVAGNSGTSAAKNYMNKDAVVLDQTSEMEVLQCL